MLGTFFPGEMAWLQVREGTWFQQDAAVSHMVHISMMVLQNLFPNYLVLSFVVVAFPARSLNLTATDFFVWGCFESVVFCIRPASILDWQDSICHSLVIFQLTWCKAIPDMLYLARMCLNRMLDIQWTSSIRRMSSKVHVVVELSQVCTFISDVLDTLLCSCVFVSI